MWVVRGEERHGWLEEEEEEKVWVEVDIFCFQG